MKVQILTALAIIAALTTPATDHTTPTTNATPAHKVKPAPEHPDTDPDHYAAIFVNGTRCEVRNEGTGETLATFTAEPGADYEAEAKRLVPQITAFRVDNELAE